MAVRSKKTTILGLAFLVLLVALGCLLIAVTRQGNQGVEQKETGMTGFWMVDPEDEANKKNGKHWRPPPFFFDGTTITCHYESLRYGMPGGYFRLHTQWRSNDLYYLDAARNQDGNYPWIKFASREGRCFVREHNDKEWVYSKKSQTDVSKHFSGYFQLREVYDYERGRHEQ
jgi:hypothetical protein